MPLILTCSGISKTFERAAVPISFLQDHLLSRPQRKQRIEALKNISFDLQQGEWVGLFGQNGCGKTTLLRILAGVMQPDAGSATINGGVSSYFDFLAGFHEERNAIENLYFHGLFQGMPPEEARSRIQQIIAFAGVESHQHLPLKCYSTGMKLRLGFAAATHTPADLYLMDEIFAVGDTAFKEQCFRKLLEMKAAGSSALIVSHSLRHLNRVCDRVLMMEQGALTPSPMVA